METEPIKIYLRPNAPVFNVPLDMEKRNIFRIRKIYWILDHDKFVDNHLESGCLSMIIDGLNTSTFIEKELQKINLNITGKRMNAIEYFKFSDIIERYIFLTEDWSRQRKIINKLYLIPGPGIDVETKLDRIKKVSARAILIKNRLIDAWDRALEVLRNNLIEDPTYSINLDHQLTAESG